MKLQIIAGPAGSGKTSYIAKEIVEELLARREQGLASVLYTDPAFSDADPVRPLILIVPDQATFRWRKILDDPGWTGLPPCRSWLRRLCLKVLMRQEGEPAFITPVGRSMAIQSALWERKKDLTLFAPMVNPGFRETLGKTLPELSLYEVSPRDMRLSAGTGGSPYLEQNIHDLEVVFESDMEFLKDRFFDPEDYLELAAGKMAASHLVRGAQVWVDGFSGFTPKEYKVLRSVMEAAGKVSVALCLDRSELSRPASSSRLFHPTREIFDNLMFQAREAGIRVEPTIYLGEGKALPRFAASPDLARLERAARLSGEDSGLAGEVDPGSVSDDSESLDRSPADAEEPGVVVVSAANPRAEVEYVAREIVKLVRDEGLRYRDITVERTTSDYADLVSLVFKTTVYRSSSTKRSLLITRWRNSSGGTGCSPYLARVRQRLQIPQDRPSSHWA